MQTANLGSFVDLMAAVRVTTVTAVFIQVQNAANGQVSSLSFSSSHLTSTYQEKSYEPHEETHWRLQALL